MRESVSIRAWLLACALCASTAMISLAQAQTSGGAGGATGTMGSTTGSTGTTGPGTLGNNTGPGGSGSTMGSTGNPTDPRFTQNQPRVPTLGGSVPPPCDRGTGTATRPDAADCGVVHPRTK